MSNRDRTPDLPGDDKERLEGLDAIIEFTGVPRRTFYHRGYMRALKNSPYLFWRREKFGRMKYWSYKNLIQGWMIEVFQDEDLLPKRQFKHMQGKETPPS
jgi:hypothetical protein